MDGSTGTDLGAPSLAFIYTDSETGLCRFMIIESTGTIINSYRDVNGDMDIIENIYSFNLIVIKTIPRNLPPKEF